MRAVVAVASALFLLCRGARAAEALEEPLGLALLGGDAPWYCPPAGTAERDCVRKYRFQNRPYVEETVLPSSVRVLQTIVAEPGDWAGAFVEPAQALLTLIEGVRVLMCHFRFKQCVNNAVAFRVVREVCDLVDDQQELLQRFMGPSGMQSVCWSLINEGDYFPMLAAVALPLYGLVRSALPWSTTPPLANYGTRFQFEHFYEQKAGVYAKRRINGTEAPVLSPLTYPALFSPGGVCAGRSEREQAARTGNRHIRADDVAEALRRLEGQGVPLSHFVVNFGAADGECGLPEDWNADPANCLIAAGAAGVLVEGDPQYLDVLANKFKDRSNVSLAFGYMALDGVTNLLRRHISQHPAFTWSPDLLKVDLDHADCLFVEEALRVIHPKLLHVEYASFIPPPMEYVQNYQDILLSLSLVDRKAPILAGGLAKERQQRAAGGRELTGCSLSALLRRTPGYTLVAAGPEDVLLVRRDLQSSLGAGPPPDPWESWVQGAFCHPQHLYTSGYVLWGFDFRILADRTLDIKDRMGMLKALFEEHGTSEFSLTVEEPPP